MTALKYLRHLQRSDYPAASRARISAAMHQELESLMDHYLTFLLERKLNTPSFIREVRKQP
jgi:recombinational DNA repair protein (RecF pathway)